MFSNRSPWRRPCKWSKHFGDHRTIKYTNKIRVDLLVFHNYQIYSIHKTPLNVGAPYETATASPAYLSTQNARTHAKCYAAASPHWLFTFLTNFKISDFNKEHTSSLKMIWIWSKHVGAFLSVLIWKFNTNILLYIKVH